MFPPYKYIITRILRNVNKNIRKIRKKNNRDFHTTKLNLPTGNLDSKTSADVLVLLKRTSGEFNQTIVMITHNNEIAQLADRIVRIEDGKIVG
nr:MAG TPA: hypothetical protein [Caudoviricetes sp.]